MEVLAVLQRQAVAVHVAAHKLSGHLGGRVGLALLNEGCPNS